MGQSLQAKYSAGRSVCTDEVFHALHMPFGIQIGDAHRDMIGHRPDYLELAETLVTPPAKPCGIEVADYAFSSLKGFGVELACPLVAEKAIAKGLEFAVWLRGVDADVSRLTHGLEFAAVARETMTKPTRLAYGLEFGDVMRTVPTKPKVDLVGIELACVVNVAGSDAALSQGIEFANALAGVAVDSLREGIEIGESVRVITDGGGGGGGGGGITPGTSCATAGEMVYGVMNTLVTTGSGDSWFYCVVNPPSPAMRYINYVCPYAYAVYESVGSSCGSLAPESPLVGVGQTANGFGPGQNLYIRITSPGTYQIGIKDTPW